MSCPGECEQTGLCSVLTKQRRGPRRTSEGEECPVVNTKRDHLRALALICQKLGGELAVVSQEKFDALFYNSRGRGFYEAPFTSAHGLHWHRKIVYAVRGREEVGSIIHEMGHVFADRSQPHNSNEWDWFGWEIAVARAIDASRTWSRHNANYNTGEGGGDEWGSLSSRRRRSLVADRIGRAREIGVVNRAGAPRSIR